MKKRMAIAAVLLYSGVLHAEVDPLKRVAVELAAGLGSTKAPRAPLIAVLAIPHHDNHRSDGPFLVSERLTTLLVKQRGLRVLERSQIVQLLDEMHLSETGMMDPKTARRIGQALGADIIITGTLIDLQEKDTEVNVRGMLADSGKILAASRTIVQRDWKSRPVLHSSKHRDSILDWNR